MTDSKSNHSAWKFSNRETIVKKDEKLKIPGVDGIDRPITPTEYTVKRRFIDIDRNKRLYELEWTVGNETETQIVHAKIVRQQYRSLDAAANSQGADDD